MIKNVRLIEAAVFLLVLATACGTAGSQSSPNPATARAATLFAVLTASSRNLQNPSPTLALTAIPAIPTNSPIPPATATPAATELPTVTPTSSQLATPCYRAYFVKDITIPDYYEVAPGTTFVKTWRFKNTGSCNWAADTSIGFYSGTKMGGPSSQELGQAVVVGDQIDISLTLVAPTDVGTYTGYWMLLTPAGGRFGIGDAGDQSFWVLIVVKGGTVTITRTPTLGTPTNTKTSTAIPSATATPTITQTPTPNSTLTQTYAYPAP
jgi:hypothetical protein